MPSKRVVLTVAVHQARGLRTALAAATDISTFVSFQFLNERPVESVVCDAASPSYTLSRSYDLTVDEDTLNGLVNKPFTVCIWQLGVVSSERVLLGRAYIDLVPLLQGETEVNGWFPIRLCADHVENCNSEIQVRAVVSEVLLTEAEREAGLLLTFSLGSMYYTLAAQVPANLDEGKRGLSSTFDCVMRLPSSGSSAEDSPKGYFLTLRGGLRDSPRGKAGDEKRSVPRAFEETAAEREMTRVVWGLRAHAYFTHTTVARLRVNLANNAGAVVEVMRVISSSTGVDPAGVKETLQGGIDLSALAKATAFSGTCALSPLLSPTQDTEATVYLKFVISISRPLVYVPPKPKYQLSDLVQPATKEVPIRSGVDMFCDRVNEMTLRMAEQYSTMQGSEGSHTGEELKKKFLEHLVANGSYQSMKEYLREAVIEVIREGTPRARVEGGEVFSNLYVQLVTLANKTLNTMFAPHVLMPSKTCTSTLDRSTESLLSMAHEAETNGDLHGATRYFQELLLRNQDDATAWTQMGFFALRSGDHVKAEECFKRALQLDESDTESMMALACLRCLEEEFEEALTFAREAVDTDSHKDISWPLLAQIYHMAGIMTEFNAVWDHLASMEAEAPNACVSARQRLIHFLLDSRFLSMAEDVLEEARADSTLPPQMNGELNVLAGRLFLIRGDMDKAEMYANAATVASPDNVDSWGLLGEVLGKQSKQTEAKEAYENAIRKAESGDIDPPGPILMSLGKLCEEMGDHSAAKKAYLHVRLDSSPRMPCSPCIQAIRGTPTAGAWLGAGMACLHLGEWHLAEEALSVRARIISINRVNQQLRAYL